MGLTQDFNNEEKKYFEGNTKDSTLLVRTDETISQVINLARKNAERLCRGKWQKTPQDLSSTIICIRGDDSETTPLRGGANSLSGKVVIIQNANLYLEPNQTSNSGPITLFIDRGNLFLPSSSATGDLQTFDSF